MNEHRDLGGEAAVGRALQDDLPSPAGVMDIALYVNGRMIHTKTDEATVARIMAILTGTGG
jgi:hypothetical protein